MEKPSISERLAALKAGEVAQDIPALAPDISSRLRVNIVKRAIEFHWEFWQYKEFAEWLGCYKYVMPADRFLLPELAAEIVRWYVSKEPGSLGVRYAWTPCSLIEHALDKTEQKEILSWTQEFSYSHTPRF